MKRSPVALALSALTLAALLVAAGCSRNPATALLSPTGYRPAPAHWSGSVYGLLYYDPTNTPDLGVAPYPPTRVELWRDTVLVAFDSLATDSTWFRFSGVRSGTYRVIARSSMFHAGVASNVVVNEARADAGNLTLTVDPSAASYGMEIIGTIPGFRLSDVDYGMYFPLDSTRAGSPTLGLWSYPYPYPLPDAPTDEDLAYFHYAQTHLIPAGTYHFKFATAPPPSATDITGWGDAIGGTLTAPVTNHPSVLADGPATDIVMTFPQTGVYAFTLDERRQTFSVQFLHAAPARSARLARR